MMHQVSTRRAAAALLLLAGPALGAQALPAPPANPAPVVSSRCGVSHTAVRAAAGGVLGAWVGFVVAKIRLSDWNESSHSASATRMRNRTTIGGAVIGLAIGSLLRTGNSCAPTLGVPAMRVGREPITAEEINKVGQTGSVYDLIFALRRNWLNLRGTESLTEGPETLIADGKEINLVGAPRLAVYLDNARLGSIDELRTLPVAGVTGVRFFEGPDATYRWGAGNSHGAIQVVTSGR